MDALTRSTLINVVGFGAGTAIAAVLFAAVAEFGAGYVVLALAIFAGMTAFGLRHLDEHRPRAAFGRANEVTLFRVGLIALVGGMIAIPAPPLWLQWTALGVTAIAIALDGVDGLLARRRGSATRLGAQFDMEVDAGLILLMSVLALQTGKVGVWVLMIGLWRYVFVVAGLVFRKLRAPLGPAVWRKAVCVLQSVGLLIVLLPVTDPLMASVVAAVALTALTLSFAYDTWRMALSDAVPLAAGTLPKS